MSEPDNIHLTIPQCPACKGHDLDCYGVKKNRVVRYYQCRRDECGHKFKVTVTNPAPK